MGAVAVYLLIGMVWSVVYHLVALRIPGAFNIQGTNATGNGESLQSQLFYFSFVTLTWIGYGDIGAVYPIVRMLVILEGVVGQLFPAILIARLVSLHVQSKHKLCPTLYLEDVEPDSRKIASPEHSGKEEGTL